MQYSGATQTMVEATTMPPSELWARASDHQGPQATIMHPYAPNDIHFVNKSQCAVSIYVALEPIIRPIRARRGSRDVLAGLDFRRRSIIKGSGVSAAVTFCERAAHRDWPIQALASLQWRLHLGH